MRVDEPMFAGAGRVARGLREVTDDLAALHRPGFWAVHITFEGAVTCARFGDVAPGPPPAGRPWIGPAPSAWTSSLDETAYRAAVGTIREHIAAGDVYQANLCRVLHADLPHPTRADAMSLAALLAAGNPAPQAGTLRLPDHGIAVIGASPELYLSRTGNEIESAPIKGTARPGTTLGEKDRAENVMIVDLVRNDLGRVCVPGSVTVPVLCAEEPHPGLVHLVSTVRGRLRPDVGWPDVINATFPPGSVSGAPKEAALDIIRTLEPIPRGPYCGALGWVDNVRGTAALAVGIRTFWIDDDALHFGTGAGITWGSDPAAEWAETELKAAHLLNLAAGAPVGSRA